MWREQLVSMAAQWRELADWECEIARRKQQMTRRSGGIERKSLAAIRA